jgi:isopentenyl diphosphate isomerase/L-lactate dehydrogenase-like FMN-dependent dehydrogenase
MLDGPAQSVATSHMQAEGKGSAAARAGPADPVAQRGHGGARRPCGAAGAVTAPTGAGGGGVPRRLLLAGSATTGAGALPGAPAPAAGRGGPDRALAILSPERLEAEARAALPPAVYDWIAGGAGAELTMRGNRAALDAAAITPRMLTGAGPPELSLTLLGQRLAHPVMVCPMAMHGVAHPRAEAATAAGAAAAGALFIAPMAATVSLEEAAAAAGPGAPRWLQIYVPRDRAIALDLAARAEAAGCSALVVTVDAPVPAFRERDLASGFAPPSDLVAGNQRPGYSQALLGGTDAELSWDDIAWLAARTRLPLVLKGILSPRDAAQAVGAGAGAVFVSSHGGRQLDGVPAAFEALPRCAAAVDGRVPVLMDSGVRRGLDVLKALAAGAQAVAVGRPVWWGLTLGGAAGVRSVLERVLAELASAMRLAGCASLSEVTPALLRGD